MSWSPEPPLQTKNHSFKLIETLTIAQFVYCVFLTKIWTKIKACLIFFLLFSKKFSQHSLHELLCFFLLKPLVYYSPATYGSQTCSLNLPFLCIHFIIGKQGRNIKKYKDVHHCRPSPTRLFSSGEGFVQGQSYICKSNFKQHFLTEKCRVCKNKTNYEQILPCTLKKKWFKLFVMYSLSSVLDLCR